MNAIPATQPVNHADIRAECRALQAEGMPLTEQARQSGVAYKTFAAYIGDAYQGDNEKVGGEIAKWLRARKERAATSSSLIKQPDWVETPTAAHLVAMFTFAQTAPDIVVGATGAGHGKTVTARHYRSTRPNVYLATMRPTTGGVHTMLAEIAEVVGVEERMANKLSRAIGRKLAGSQSLLIIDEGQHLKTEALDELRSLHDGWQIGIAILGNESVYTRIEGLGRQSSLAQLFSRVGMRLSQAKLPTADAEALIAAWGIDDADTVKLLKAIAAKPGALRSMSKTLSLAHVAGGITADTVRAAYRQLGAVMTE